SWRAPGRVLTLKRAAVKPERPVKRPERVGSGPNPSLSAAETHISLNEMFQELGELMEDTQHILGEAVDQVCCLFVLEIGGFGGCCYECMVDEDCGDLKYCLYEIQSSRCLPCTASDMDEECCSTQMCVWGQCTANVSRGTEGTICQGQNDCRPELCCAFQRGKLLFPVCNPKPQRGESCLNHPNLLMDMLAWDQEGPRDHCQCADHLQCRHESAWHSLFRLKVSGINLLPVCLTDCKVQELFNRHRIKRQRGPAQDYTPLCLCCRQDLELWSENNANTNMLQGASHLDALVAVRLLHGCNIAVAQWQ
uniref:Dickkopf WNT signaling pathway inhibitor 3b n=1 Tax=Oryzias latipes TaxID=8090 RepID=A0A3B3IFB7_ORYLA